MVVSGSSHQPFARQIAQSLGTTLSPITLKTFSCGELYVRYDASCRGKDVFIVQTCRTGQMNDDLTELLLMIDVARQSFANKVHVVLPYFAYARQDKIHAAREGISAKLFAKLLVSAGADHIITVQFHSDQTQGFFDCVVDNVNPRRIFAEYLLQKSLPDPVVVSPDAGGAKDAKKLADLIGAPFVIMHKQRPDHNVAEVTHIIGDVAGKTAIIYDDMVDTAGSVSGARAILTQQGAQPDVYLCTTHAVFSGPARERLAAAQFAEIITTDTLPVDTPPAGFSVLSIAPLMADVIRNIARGQSVSSLHL